MRTAIYLAVVGSLAGIAWHYTFLFELPLVAAIGGIASRQCRPYPPG
jgi:hypothetical protein